MLLLALLLSAAISTAVGQQAAGSCPVSLVYAADLGRGGANSNNPTFAGRVNITNTASQVLPCLDITVVECCRRCSAACCSATSLEVPIVPDAHAPLPAPTAKGSMHVSKDSSAASMP